MKTKINLLLAAVLVLAGISGYALYRSNNGVVNSVLDARQAPVMKTGYADINPVPVDFQKAAENSVASVVHIQTVTKGSRVSMRQSPDQQDPFGGMFPNDDLFKHFFGGGGSGVQPDQRASGSGVIISSDGYIVTNNHVVDGATELTVTLNDRKNYKATVVGTDPNTDLALIKIDGKNFPVMPVGNSDDVHLGEWVLAIGYPLNLDVTVTQGIVSAKSRSIGINTQGAAPVESFIQTDAAVNPGSSGGALINANGELIGINAAIASPTGAYAGYAYAIPSNLMKKVMADIMKYGKVQRGYLGISMAPENLDDAKKKELGINDDLNAVWVMETDPTGAAAQAGIRKGDAITKVNGAVVTTPSQLSEQIARLKPDDNVSITYLRGGTEHTTMAVLKNKQGTYASQQAAMLESLGASFEPVTKADAAKLGIPGGVKVTALKEGVLSDQTNMREGFVITKVGGIAVKNVDELKAALDKQDGNFQLEGVYPGNEGTYYYGINDFRK